MLTHREQLILLNLIPDIGSNRLRRLLDAFGDLDRIWAASAAELQQVEGVGSDLAARLVEGRANETRLREELELAQRAGVQVVTLEDADYPEPLRTISDPPLALYIRGRLVPEDKLAVAIVGSRHASVYGLACADRLAYDVALRGITVVSGLARGIDAAAHRGALKTPGRTIAVLGSGLTHLYPEEHEALARQIAEQGAVISEYPMETQPLPHNFPRRNRIISGLSLGVVVVEASQRSGALITADCALEQGREVFAVPGPMTAVTSQGTHYLIQQGAKLVTSVEDILEELSAPLSGGLAAGDAERGPQPTGANDGDSPSARGRLGSRSGRTRCPEHLPAEEERVFSCMDAQEPVSMDAIIEASGFGIPEVSAALLQLELKHIIKQLPGKQFVRCSPRT